MNALKKIIAAAMLASALGGCAYGGVAATGDKVVITRNDMLLFGLLRAVYVCDVTPQGAANCSAAEAP